MKHSIFRKDGTAQGVAKQRFIESMAAPDKRVIYDPYSAQFVLGTSLMKLMGHKLSVWVTQKFSPGFHEHLISRTRFIDDLVEKCARDGVEQYVILGAGYDLRAHRLNLGSALKIFEVDQAEVQIKKLSKLSDEVNNFENVTYVSIDFNHQSLSELLLAAGFDKNKSSVFTLEGVSQYITKDALLSTLSELAELTKESRSTFFMSYVDELLNSDPRCCFGEGYPRAEKRAQTIKNLTAKVGEPWISFYSSDELRKLLSESGFTLTENKTLEDLNSQYFTPVGRTVPEHHIFKLEHFIVAENKS